MARRMPFAALRAAAARQNASPVPVAGVGRRVPPSTDRVTLLQREATIAGRFLVIGLAAVGAIWLVLQVQLLAAAVVLGLAQVALLWPIARWLRERGAPAALAAIVCVVAYVAFFLSVLTFLVLRVIDAWPGLVAAGTDAVQSLTEWAQNRTADLDSPVLDQLIDQLEASAGGALGGLGGAATQAVNAAGQVVTVLLIALFFTLFALTGGDGLWRGFVGMLPGGYRAPTDAAFRSALRTAGAWFYAATATGLIDGVLIGLGLWVLDVPLALAIGALTFLFGYVPLVGATIAGAVAVAVAGVTGGWTTALWALLIVVAVQQIEGNLLAPLLLSRAINFPPLVVLLLTTGAASVFGLLGLFLAVPVAGVLAAAIQGWRREVAEPAAPPAAPPPEEPEPVPEEDPAEEVPPRPTGG
ncbi:AI-2E family transporter [Trujillonella humicola]|uniref:AI-2E family transporter n=1 Tax=Trujillonella humicola TaxID=3383699 RepID=UPI003906946B